MLQLFHLLIKMMKKNISFKMGALLGRSFYTFVHTLAPIFDVFWVGSGTLFDPVGQLFGRYASRSGQGMFSYGFGMVGGKMSGAASNTILFF